MLCSSTAMCSIAVTRIGVIIRGGSSSFAYNRASNDPVIVHHHPQYTKLDIVRNCHNRLVMTASLNGGYVVSRYP